MTDEQAAEKWYEQHEAEGHCQDKGGDECHQIAFLAGAAHGREEAAKKVDAAFQEKVRWREDHDAIANSAYVNGRRDVCVELAAAIRNQQETP